MPFCSQNNFLLDCARPLYGTSQSLNEIYKVPSSREQQVRNKDWTWRGPNMGLLDYMSNVLLTKCPSVLDLDNGYILMHILKELLLFHLLTLLQTSGNLEIPTQSTIWNFPTLHVHMCLFCVLLYTLLGYSA